jgi:surface carbohydrate biosynthesis protein
MKDKSYFYNLPKKLFQSCKIFVASQKTFLTPKPVSIVILDDTNYEYLVPLIRDRPYSKINLDGKNICCAPFILLLTFLFFLIHRNLKLAYTLAMISLFKPTIVITYIDNSSIFQLASSLNPSIRFLAVQNGNRLLDRDHARGTHRIYLREFACIGNYEIDQYSNHGAYVEKFYPIGMLLDSYYREISSAPQKLKEFDICLVSQVRPGLMQQHTERMTSSILLAQFIKRFCLEHKKTLCIAMRMHPEKNLDLYKWELEWYDKHIGEIGSKFSNIPNSFNTYKLTDKSLISVGMHSTSMREAFGRKNRILSCNFSGNPCYDFPVSGFWMLCNANYSEFEASMLYLLGLSDDDYNNFSLDARNYLTGYSSYAPTHHFLADIIEKAIDLRENKQFS